MMSDLKMTLRESGYDVYEVSSERFITDTVEGWLTVLKEGSLSPVSYGV